ARNTFEEGALLEPVNTVLKAVNRLTLLPRDTDWVVGQGPIGLMFTRLLALRGSNVLATDLLESRLALATQSGARWRLKAGLPDRAGIIRRLSGNDQWDAAVITTASDDALGECPGWVRCCGHAS